jgi:seryl-tRNA synthetase
MPSPQAAVAIDDDALRDAMVRERLLIPTGVPGVYGLGSAFDDTLTRIDRLIGRFGADDHPEVVRFPPILNRRHFTQSGYLASFPHLTGTVHSFEGTERAHGELLRAAAQGEDWSASFAATDVVLTPAACYPIYPLLAGRLPATGRLFDVMSYCFRHEPSDRAERMQMFRMREFVRAGDPATVIAWRETWRSRTADVVAALQLESRADAAADPFFGRGGVLLAESQRDQGLKTEILAPVSGDECSTAIISLNYHQDHFGERFAITTSDGAIAHTSCVGFGLERMTLALFRRHGLDRSQWSDAVREALDL